MDCRGKKNRTLGVFQFDFIWVRLILSRKWETWWTLLRPKKIWGGFQGWMKKWREKRNKFCYLGVDWERWELKHFPELTGLKTGSSELCSLDSYFVLYCLAVTVEISKYKQFISYDHYLKCRKAKTSWTHWVWNPGPLDVRRKCYLSSVPCAPPEKKTFISHF